MSNVIIIPDVHGSLKWKKAKELLKEKPDSYVVGLGDWVDDWTNNWPQQGENLEEALEWFSEDTEHRIFLLGNHDWSYISNTDDGNVSGHQILYADKIKAIFEKYKSIWNICCEIDGWVFSHAGISKNWRDTVFGEKLFYLLDSDDKGDMPMDKFVKTLTPKAINEFFRDTEFKLLNDILDWHGLFDAT